MGVGWCYYVTNAVSPWCEVNPSSPALAETSVADLDPGASVFFFLDPISGIGFLISRPKPILVTIFGMKRTTILSEFAQISSIL